MRLDRPGDVSTVLRVLCLVFNEGYSGEIDLAAEAILLPRQLAAAVDHPEVTGLLALLLLHHARRAGRTAPDGSLVPLAEQDRSRWDTEAIAEGIGLLQAALVRDRLGEYQAQAAVAALHADAPTASETTGCRSRTGCSGSTPAPLRLYSGSGRSSITFFMTRVEVRRWTPGSLASCWS